MLLKQAIEIFGVSPAWAKNRRIDFLCQEIHIEKDWIRGNQNIILEFPEEEVTVALCRDYIKEAGKKIQKFEKSIYWLKKPMSQQKSFDIEAIKQNVKIDELMSTRPTYKDSKRAKYICPLHNEKDSSFTVYKKQNTFHCFGCHAGTSVIDLYMKLNNASFVDACKVLN